MAVAQTVITILIIYLINCAHFREFQRFRQTQDCTGQPGCALDTPYESLNGFLSKLRCAIKCTTTTSCVNFNYWKSNSLCQLFYSFPYRLSTVFSCSNYDVINFSFMFLFAILKEDFLFIHVSFKMNPRIPKTYQGKNENFRNGFK